MLKRLDDLTFDNRFTQELPTDPETDNYCRQVTRACFSHVTPTKVSNPHLVAYAWEVAKELDLPKDICESKNFVEVFSGNQLLPNMDPYATCYGGHQFGNWAGQLGDGRAINLGEIVNSKGERWALQLKGAGRTPYSRNADGLAVLRSSIREFLCSEAMHHLGIPTTRALSLILTGEQVVRDMFYDGNSKAEPGAIVCRVAPSFTRFGSFQILASRGELNELKQLLNYTIRTDFPHLLNNNKQLGKTVYLSWFEEVCRNTAKMIVHWQRVGFVHGVMNTDNMSILGLTIDYGPYGWLDSFNPKWTPNTTDAAHGRYRYSQQPEMAHWNLVQLANAIYPLIEDEEGFQQALNIYSESFNQGWQLMMTEKLGIKTLKPETDKLLIETLLNLLTEFEIDMTIFYRQLAQLNVEQSIDGISDQQLIEPLTEAWYWFDAVSEDYLSRFADWLRKYLLRLQTENTKQKEKIKRMNAVNPKYVLRNYLAQLAIEKAERGDFSLVHELLEVMRHPYDEQTDKEEFAKKRPDWARNKPGCSMLSCSS